MTAEEQDALVGRVIRESKTAEEDLQRLLVKAEHIAKDIAALSKKVTDRVVRARTVGAEYGYSGPERARPQNMPRFMSDAGIEHLKDFSAAVDLDALEALDREISLAVAKALELRQEKQRLGI